VLTHLDPNFEADPHPTWDALRAAAPLTYLPEIDAWVITGNDAMRTALRHPQLSPSVQYWKHQTPLDVDAQPTPEQRFHASGLFNVTPDDHVRLRRLINRAFTPRGVEAQHAFTESLVDELLGRHRPGDHIDLYGDVYERIPVQVISNLVGFPAEYGETFKSASDTLVLTLEPLHDEVTGRRIDAAILEIEAMIEATLAERRRRPADDLLSRMLEVEEDGDRLVFDEMVALVLGLVIAGSGTTANEMAVGTFDLLTAAGQWDRLVADPIRLPRAVEEILRYSTLGYGAPRFAIDDIELAGKSIAAGDMLLCPFPAANHDPAAYDDPHRFDLERPISTHLAFSIGPHYCLGANLARLEITSAVGGLLRHFPGVTLDGEAEWQHTFLFRNLIALPVRL
jgi:cytochrome P450